MVKYHIPVLLNELIELLLYNMFWRKAQMTWLKTKNDKETNKSTQNINFEADYEIYEFCSLLKALFVNFW